MQPDPTSPLDLDAIRKRCEAATPGPWTAHDDGLVWPDRMGDPVSGSEQLADAAFIAAAREAVPTLLAALAEAQRERASVIAAGELMLAECREQRDAARADAEAAEADLRATVERVRALHSPEPGWERQWKDPADALANGWPPCAGCATVATFTEIGKCRTLAAMDSTTPPPSPEGEGAR